MELKIYNVAYYTKEYGEIKEIQDLCQGLSDYVKNKSYSESINYLRIGPVAAPKEMLEKGLWEETYKVWHSSGDATIVFHIDFEKYMNASIEEKKGLIIENLLKAVKVISKRAKIDYMRFEEDVWNYCKENL